VTILSEIKKSTNKIVAAGRRFSPLGVIQLLENKKTVGLKLS
jgi:hypothetical protein